MIHIIWNLKKERLLPLTLSQNF